MSKKPVRVTKSKRTTKSAPAKVARKTPPKAMKKSLPKVVKKVKSVKKTTSTKVAAPVKQPVSTPVVREPVMTVHPLDSGFKVGDLVTDTTAVANNWPDFEGEVAEVDGSRVKVRYTSGTERWKMHINLKPRTAPQPAPFAIGNQSSILDVKGRRGFLVMPRLVDLEALLKWAEYWHTRSGPMIVYIHEPGKSSKELGKIEFKRTSIDENAKYVPLDHPWRYTGGRDWIMPDTKVQRPNSDNEVGATHDDKEPPQSAPVQAPPREPTLAPQAARAIERHPLPVEPPAADATPLERARAAIQRLAMPAQAPAPIARQPMPPAAAPRVATPALTRRPMPGPNSIAARATVIRNGSVLNPDSRIVELCKRENGASKAELVKAVGFGFGVERLQTAAKKHGLRVGTADNGNYVMR